MKLTALAFLCIATGISISYAESFKAPELEPSIKGQELASGLFTSKGSAAAFRRGVHYACRQSQRATQRYANMLQAGCVAADLRAGADRSEILRHCYAALQRSNFARQAEKTCAALSSHPVFLVARDGQSAQLDGCRPFKRCLRQ